MTTDVSAEIAALKKKIKDAEVEIEQVKAALDGHAAEPGEEARAKAFERAGRYANSKLWPAAKLPGELASLRNDLGGLRNELAAEKNLLLEEARRAERASRDSNVAAVTMFSIKAKFEVAPTAPVHWFRSLLAKKLANLQSGNGIVVYGRA